MVFSSTVFLFVFFPMVLFLYYNPLSRKLGIAWRNTVLFAVSVFFYAWGEPVFVVIMCFSILITWLVGKHLQGKKKWVLALGVSYHLVILFIYKYLSFLSREFSLLLNQSKLVVDIALPIGISFFTFQMISYLVDVYRGSAKAQNNPIYVGLYSVLFPQLIAGPIVRYSQIAEEINAREDNWNNVALGMQRFVFGLSKKVLISNFMAQAADNIFNMAGGRSVALAWLGGLFYSLQIYYDFSGYSDMAIGLGRMFGFHFEENFNYPYSSFSVTEFWRRWHISLGTWFRDYVYIPLGGNRVSASRHVLNLFIVWALTGIWHGANWTFLAWGLFYFLLLLLEKYTGLNKKRSVFHWAYTMLAVFLGWVIFRSNTLGDSLAYMGNLIGIQTAGAVDAAALECLRSTWAVLLAACIGVFPISRRLNAWMDRRHCLWLKQVWVLLIFVCSLLQVVSSTYNPFIYFNF